MRSSHDDEAGKPRTNLIARALTPRRFAVAAGMRRILVKTTGLASGLFRCGNERTGFAGLAGIPKNAAFAA